MRSQCRIALGLHRQQRRTQRRRVVDGSGSEPDLTAERRELLAISLAAARAREAAAMDRLHAESAIAQLKMADFNATR